MDQPSTDVSSLSTIPLEEIKCARDRLKDHVMRTPLVRLNINEEGREVYLKLENLQTTGSFKQRGACNALLGLTPEQLTHGVYCPSAGNFAQGVAYMATKLGVKSTIIVPDNAPQTKLNAIRGHGGEVLKVPYDTWWGTMVSQRFEGMRGTFLHPVCSRHVIAGNGTIGLEILEDLPDVDAIVCPFGGGGLVSGIGSAIKPTNPSVKLTACEVSLAAPLTNSRLAGQPTTLKTHQNTFIDGIGGRGVFPEMWGLLEHLVDDVVTVELQEVAAAVRVVLERNRVLAEGAGAAPVAAAMAGKCGAAKKVVAVVSGGNIDLEKLGLIIEGKVPQP